MIKFTRDQKAEAFDNLPKDLKGVIMSNTLGKAFESIGSENKLPLDKTGILGELVIVTMLGLLPREELQINIQKELGLNGLQASAITKSVNENIFLKTREILQSEEENESIIAEKGTAETIQPSTYPDLNKADILAEIENPTPAVHPISIVDQTLPGPAKPREILLPPGETGVSKPQIDQKDVVAKQFIAGKMTETVSIPSKKYSVDPYREPIA